MPGPLGKPKAKKAMPSPKPKSSPKPRTLPKLGVKKTMGKLKEKAKKWFYGGEGPYETIPSRREWLRKRGTKAAGSMTYEEYVRKMKKEAKKKKK